MIQIMENAKLLTIIPVRALRIPRKGYKQRAERAYYLSLFLEKPSCKNRPAKERNTEKCKGI